MNFGYDLGYYWILGSFDKHVSIQDALALLALLGIADDGRDKGVPVGFEEKGHGDAHRVRVVQDAMLR